MTVTRERKLKKLIDHWLPGKVATSSWLREMGISGSLTQEYLLNGWIESIGKGAYKKTKDEINWYGGLASIQQQLKKEIHVGGPTALAMRGKSHYIRFGKERVFLFHIPDVKIPKWFVDYKWNQQIEPIATSVFPSKNGISEVHYQGIELSASSLERAILECIYLAPQKFDLLECYQLLESLRTLRPGTMQPLLEECRSIKVKRLFLYMAKKADLPVSKYMELSHVNLGTGDRVIVKKGVYNPEFKISIPKELHFYG